jgi:hypothetical protein
VFSLGSAGDRTRKRVPIVGRQLSKPEELREAGLGFDRGNGRAGPVCRFIPPETEDAAGRDKLFGQSLLQSPGDPIGDLLPTVSAAIFVQHLSFVADHLSNGDGEQNGFGRGAGHDTAGEVICRSIAARRLRRASCEAFPKPADERLQHLAKSARVARRMLGDGLYPAAAKFGETEAVALKLGPSHPVSRWGVLSGPKNADPAKLPRRVIKRTVKGGDLRLSGLRREGRVSPRSPEVDNDKRQPEIAAKFILCSDQRRSRRRLGNFLAEIPHKVLNGIIDLLMATSTQT